MGVPSPSSARAAVRLLADAVLPPDEADAACRSLDDGRPDTAASDLLRVVYRLVFAALARSRGGVIEDGASTAALESPALDVRLLTPDVRDGAARELGSSGCDSTDAATALGRLHESLLTGVLPGAGPGRKSAGSWFTPPALVEHLLDEALEPALDDAAAAGEVSVCDPACGSGAFLVASARRIARRLVAMGTEPRRGLLHAVTRCVHGVDLDPAALELARVTLWLELVEPGRPVAMPELQLRAGEALLGIDWAAAFPRTRQAGGFDVVVGNPPFLNRLETLTATPATVARRLDQTCGGTLRPYTDVSAVFLQRAASWVRPGGRVALVQPQSLLAARDAAGVREHLAAGCSVESLWASDVRVFDASVLTCAPVLRRGADQGAVRRSHGPSFEPVPPRRVTTEELRGEWSFLVAAGLGIPETELDLASGTVGDLASCTADFRDQYYGLRPYLREAAECPADRWAPLVTTGLIDPAELRWGRSPTRVLKRRWAAPVVDLDALAADPALARWAADRLVPKVLVATQGRVVEAVADLDGRLLPSVPTVTVAAPAERLWHVLAVLLAPPVVAHAAARYAGTGLTMRSVKLSARQVAALPLPTGAAAWDRAASLLPTAQRDDEQRPLLLAEVAALMCRAYGVDDPAVLRWWLQQAGVSAT